LSPWLYFQIRNTDCGFSTTTGLAKLGDEYQRKHKGKTGTPAGEWEKK
jgi:hypothetical protein